MPRPVVPILPLPAAASRITSSSVWIGRISGQLSATTRFSGVIDTPCPSSRSISALSAHGSSTTPLPIIDSVPVTMPEGSRLSL